MKRIDELRLQLLELWAAPNFDPEKIGNILLEIRKLRAMGERGDPKLVDRLQKEEGWERARPGRHGNKRRRK